MSEKSNSARTTLTIGITLGLIGIAAASYNMWGCELASVDPSISDAEENDSGELVAEARAIRKHMKKARGIQDYAPHGAMIGDTPRFTPLFFSPEFWQITLDDEKKNKFIDIYDVTAPAIHKGIPNMWFIDNGLSSILGGSNAPLIDSDNDGFSNNEEFACKTLPNDATSYPEIINELFGPKVVILETITSKAHIVIDPSINNSATPPDNAKVRIFNQLSDSRPSSIIDIKKGTKFGIDKKDAERFIVKDIIRKGYKSSFAAIDDPNAAIEDENAIVIEDTKSILDDKNIIIRAGKPRPNDRFAGTDREKGRLIKDTVVTLKVTAGSKKDDKSAVFHVPVGASFKLPGGSNKTWILKSTDSQGGVNVHEEGSDKLINIQQETNPDAESGEKG